MNRKFILFWTATLILGFASAWADEAEEPELPAEATIRLMEDVDAEDIDAVMHEVQLPELPASAQGNKGLETAADAKARGKDFGADRAAAGRDNAAEAAENAQDRAEGRGRAEDLPDNVPGRPGRPDDLPTPRGR